MIFLKKQKNEEYESTTRVFIVKETHKDEASKTVTPAPPKAKEIVKDVRK